MTGRTVGPLRPGRALAIRAAPLDVDQHAEQRVRYRERVCSGRLDRQRDHDDVRTFGESFTISGRLVTASQARVTAAAEAGVVGEEAAAVADVGQEMLTSSPAMPGTPSRVPASSNSAIDSPEMLAMTGTRPARPDRRLVRTTPRRPRFWRPIAFSIPAGVSAIRGSGCRRAATVMPFEQIAPSRWMSTSGWYSVP